jgi:secreted PhoX family phosphatase
MDDGLVVPGAPDGMAAFPGPYGLTVLIRNHELSPEDPGPFGKNRKLFTNVNPKQFYDAAEGLTPCSGGTTTIVYDTQARRVVRQFLSLGGTIRNCAGGPTPWNSWITCEETQDLAGRYELTNVTIAKDHGYNFEVPVTSKMCLADPVPLKEMGRFRHEAVAVDPATSIVYQTEDQDDGILYRFLPNQAKKLHRGGQLQTLHVKGQPSCDARNWNSQAVAPGSTIDVEWKNIDNPEAPDDDLRQRGVAGGAACFARGEGMWRGHQGEIYFASTSGGKVKKGQIWKYTPSPHEGTNDERKHCGKLELFIESQGGGLVQDADNLTVAPWGDLIVCEDRATEVVRLMGVTPDGHQYPFAMNHTNGELAGVCFSPDGSTLFVNIQKRGLTLAITGPWQQSPELL